MIDERTFPNEASSVTAARRYVLRTLSEAAAPVSDSVALMVSELSANAVRHTGTHFTVMLDQTDTRIRVSVSDHGPGQPVVRTPDPTEPSGRGLQIVDALADAWGIVPSSDGDGKTVWFALDLPARAPETARRGRESVETFESGATSTGSIPNASSTNPSPRNRGPQARGGGSAMPRRARARA